MSLEKLTRPLDPEDMELRIGRFMGTTGFVEMLIYKTARVDAKRLDEAFPMKWKNKFERDSKGRLFCTIEIWNDEIKDWVGRSDTGVESMTESEKGEASDAFKRAGFKWGIGAELYHLPKIKLNLTSEEFELDKGKCRQTWKLDLSKWTVETKGGLVIKDELGVIRFGKGKKPTDNKKQSVNTDTKPKPKSLLDEAIDKFKADFTAKGYKEVSVAESVKKHYGCEIDKMSLDNIADARQKMKMEV